MPPPPGNFNSRFTNNETIIYEIGYNGAATLDSQSFNFISYPDGGEGEYFAAAHIQGIDDGDEDNSGWVAVVPEPVSSSLFIIGGLTLVFRRFWKRKT